MWGTKAITARVDVDVDAARPAVGEEYGLTREGVRGPFDADREIKPALSAGAREVEAELASDLLRAATRERSTLSERDLRARSYELSAGVCHPSEADTLRSELKRAGELIELEGSQWTTGELRERELRMLALASKRSSEVAAPLSTDNDQGREDADRA